MKCLEQHLKCSENYVIIDRSYELRELCLKTNLISNPENLWKYNTNYVQWTKWNVKPKEEMFFQSVQFYPVKAW